MIIESPLVQTPALLLHLDVVKRNVAGMAERARRLGVRLRPHAKTHKCVELACLQLEHGAHGLTVATLVEARELARGGLTDLTWAFPLDPTHLPHVRRIVDETGATLRVVVDDLATARALAGSGLRVWLKVDCGYHRAGVDPASTYALEVGRELARERGLVFEGILSHSGHAYRTANKGEAARVAEEERRVMVGFAERLRGEGIAVREISVGSTPSMAAVEDLTGVTEARPGNYVFYDRTMVLIGCCAPEDVGVTVLASVVSHQPGASHFIVDAGALALSKDAGPGHVGPPAMGAVKGHPELSVATLSQEHGLIRAESRATIEGRFQVGERIEIIPNHSCLTVAHFDEYCVVEDGGWRTGGESREGGDGAAAGRRGARLGDGRTAAHRVRRDAGAPRAATPPRRVDDCVGRGRARSLRFIRVPDATELAAPRARGAADLQDPSRLRDRDARRHRLAAHEPRGLHPPPTAPPDRPLRRAGVVRRAAHGNLQLCLPLRDEGAMRRVMLRHLLLAALPLVLGVAAGQGFWLTQKQSCSRLVGPLFAAKCHGRQLEYQGLFQTVGTATGSLLATLVGGWLELRRRRVVQQPDPTGESS